LGLRVTNGFSWPTDKGVIEIRQAKIEDAVRVSSLLMANAAKRGGALYGDWSIGVVTKWITSGDCSNGGLAFCELGFPDGRISARLVPDRLRRLAVGPDKGSSHSVAVAESG